MTDKYKGVDKIKSRLRPGGEKLVVKLSGGSLTKESLLTLERFAWMQGKTIIVDRDGTEFTIPELRKELEDGE
jgi:hypothetical protein